MKKGVKNRFQNGFFGGRDPQKPGFSLFAGIEKNPDFCTMFFSLFLTFLFKIEKNGKGEYY